MHLVVLYQREGQGCVKKEVNLVKEKSRIIGRLKTFEVDNMIFNLKFVSNQ